MDNLKKNSIQLFQEVHQHFFSTKHVTDDPETHSSEWDVEYAPDLDKTYRAVVDVVKQLENASAKYDDSKLKDIIKIGKITRQKLYQFKISKGHLEEDSTTPQGGASFLPGDGEQYATPKAFNKNKNAKGAATKFYYKLGYKAVPNKIKGSGLEVKQLFEVEPINETSDFQRERISAFDDIETRLNALHPLVSNAKNETADYYNEHPGSYDIYKPTEMILDYLKNIETLLTANK